MKFIAKFILLALRAIHHTPDSSVSKMKISSIFTLFATLTSVIQSKPLSIDIVDSVDISFYTEEGCNIGFIETRSVTVNECFALTNGTLFRSYLVPSSIPDSLVNQSLYLEAGDSNPVNCDIGRCVELSTSLECQLASNDGETASWFGMFW